MISAFVREFVIPFLLFLLLRSLLSGLFSRRRPASRTEQPTPSPPAPSGGTLHKDPICGTYVSADSAITLTIKGEQVYFCSRECWDKYHAG
jgi:YHS domain-containing protein